MPAWKRSRRPAWREPRGSREKSARASRLRLRLAPDQRLGVALEVVGQGAQRPGGAADLLQGVAQLLLDRSVPAQQGRIRVLEYPVGGANDPPQVVQRRVDLVLERRLGSGEHAADIPDGRVDLVLEGPVGGGEHTAHLV